MVKTLYCSQMCTLMLGCTHWTWNGDRGNECYLKLGHRALSDAIFVAGNVACGKVT